MSAVSPLVLITVSLLHLLANANEIQTNVSTSNCKQYPGIPGLPGSNGVPGVPGTPGCPGRDGTKGKKGSTGKRGLQGATGFPGKLGPQGPSGQKGMIGEKGQSGTVGTKGQKGDTANIDPRQLANWKQCAWRATTGTDNGKIKECSFNKLFDNTALRVSYQGAIHLYSDEKCNRWYFKFNGNECSGPLTIESVLYTDWISGTPNIHRHHSFDGFCENLRRGTISVELWVGQCSGVTLGNAYTGWNSVSRIMIEEVPPPQ